MGFRITMDQTIALPSYQEVAVELEKTSADIKPAEIHGLLCGVLSSTSGKLDEQWEKLLLLPQMTPNLKAFLQQLAISSHELMDTFSFEFTLFLPSDDTDINERTEALGLWCQGFLTGLQQGIQFGGKKFSNEVTEALNDITEISQVNYGNIAENEEDEVAFAELVEYVRMTTLMLYQEFKAYIPQGTNGNSLH